MKANDETNCLKQETILIQSIICTKKIKLFAHTDAKIKKEKNTNIQFVPDLSNIRITGTLLKDLIVIQGTIKGNIISGERCIKKITLSFQEEIICEGICPGDHLKNTQPILEGVLPPQVITHGKHEAIVRFKVVLSTQVTVIREKIGTISVAILGDINEDNCKQPMHPPTIVFCEEDKDDYGHDDHHEEDESCECELCKKQKEFADFPPYLDEDGSSSSSS
jgi:hypothetical protein